MFDTTIRYFCEVARLGSIRRAAEALNVATSALSRQMANLEATLGTSLFDRHARGVHLTEAGRLFYGHARATMLDLDRVRGEIDALAGRNRGHIRVCTVEGLIGDLVPDAVADYRARAPEVTLSVLTEGTLGVVRAVADDDADVGFAFHPQPHRDVEVFQEAAQPLHAVVAPDAGFALPERPRLRDLVALPLIIPPDSSYGVRQLIDGVAGAEALPLRPVLTSDSITGLREMAARGLGVTLLPLPSVHKDVRAGRLRAVPLADEALRDARVGILVRRGRILPPVTRAFLSRAGLLLAESSSTPSL